MNKYTYVMIHYKNKQSGLLWYSNYNQTNKSTEYKIQLFDESLKNDIVFSTGIELLEAWINKKFLPISWSEQEKEYIFGGYTEFPIISKLFFNWAAECLYDKIVLEIL